MLNVSYDTKSAKGAAARIADPTSQAYGDLNRAYDFFNAQLFDGRLPRCLITMQRHKGAYGYFAPQRFGSADGATITDEIALNPAHFTGRPAREILSTLAHEMTHLEHQHFGKPGRKGYHNKQWAALMKAIGLHPSSTGAPGGKETGQKVSHYIVAGGPFDLAVTELEKAGFAELLGDRWDEADEKEKKARAAKAKSKTAFECEGCGLKAWAKADASLMCGDCDLPLMICEPAD